MPLQPRDWTMLAISAAGGAALTPVQLQKALFLVGREQSDAVGPDFYEFIPYNYGPFARGIYTDAEELAAEGYVTVSTAEGRYKVYAATPEGLRYGAMLGMDVPGGALSYLDRVVKWTLRLSFQDLVRAIYTKYPEFRANSVFQG